MKQRLSEEFKRMQELAGLITENQYNLQPIESILLTNISPEEKMDKIGAYLTDTEDGLDLGNTNLGDIIDEWFSTKKYASRFLNQIETLINNPKEIKDVSSDITENKTNITNKAKNFIKSNHNPGEEEDYITYEYPLKEIDPEIVKYIKDNKRLNVTVNGQATAMTMKNNKVIIEFF